MSLGKKKYTFLSRRANDRFLKVNAILSLSINSMDSYNLLTSAKRRMGELKAVTKPYLGNYSNWQVDEIHPASGR